MPKRFTCSEQLGLAIYEKAQYVAVGLQSLKLYISCQNVGYLKAVISRGFFPLLMPTYRAVLLKISNPNDKFRQTVEADSGKRRLVGGKFRLELLGIGLVGHSF